ncbi:hypothetical protein Acr_00g0058930 [Actinidia rufa]|uniref:Uncharacterized protein n=1 Tax=Actinidia rufa TaxID=165716 RepID=A0A7J0DQ04_9ERIC|nr:hypothetical protein Acr_00g0058930 [Actinidia rufa]
MFNNVDIRNLENTLPSWISDHLGELSNMMTKVIQYPSSPRENSFNSEGSPSIDTRPPLERYTNIMTRGKLDCLQEQGQSKSCLGGIQATSRDGRINSSSSREITRNSPMDYLGSLEFRYRGAPQHCNVLSILIEIEQERFDQISSTLEQGQYYLIKDVLHSKSFLKSFTLDYKKMVSSGRDNVKKKLVADAAHIATDEGDSYLSQDDPPRGEPSRDDSVEYIGTIRKMMRDILPPLPYQTLLSLLRAKIQPSFFNWELGSSSSSLEAWSDPRLPPELRSDEDKHEELAQMAKGRDEPKEKEAYYNPWGGDLSNPEVVLGLKASIMKNPAMLIRAHSTYRQRGGVKVGSELGDHKVVVLVSSLTNRSREMREKAMTQQANVASIWAQNMAKGLDVRVAKIEAEKQHAAKKLRRMKEEHNTALERYMKEIVELKGKEAFSKTSVIEEFKSSDDFKKAMEKATFSSLIRVCQGPLPRAVVGPFFLSLGGGMDPFFLVSTTCLPFFEGKMPGVSSWGRFLPMTMPFALLVSHPLARPFPWPSSRSSST